MLWLFSEMGTSDSFPLPVNMALLATLGGVFGLVLSGFTAWHISLAVRGMTTIESMESTRYVSPLRKARHEQQQYRVDNEYEPEDDALSHDAYALADSVGHRIHYYGGRIMDAAHHASVPGIATPPEEREEDEEQGGRGYGHEMDTLPQVSSPPPQQTYAELERQRDADRYQNYLDEQDSERMPSAFNLGWRRNLLHLFGDRPLLWFLPVRTTTGDGWHWEPSKRFLEVRENLRIERETHLSRQREYYHRQGNSMNNYNPRPPKALVSRIPGRPSPNNGYYSDNKTSPHSSSGSAEYDDDCDPDEDNPLLRRGGKGSHND